MSLHSTHLLPIVSSPGLEAIGEDLPEGDSVRPNVTGRGKLEVVDTLRSTPGNGQFQINAEVALVVVLAHS